jgi:sec-independent protein translocase protein TatC
VTDEIRPVAESLLAHLLELRSRLLKSVVAILVAFAVMVPFANRIYLLLARPLLRSLPAEAFLVSNTVLGPWIVPFKLAFFASLLLAMPVVLYQLWAFVAPGLYRSERRLALPLLVSSVVLFYAGCAFLYFVMLPAIFALATGAGPSIVHYQPDMGAYLDFTLVLMVGGGLAFEVPVAVAIAVILGWVTPQQLGEWRGYIVVLIFVIAAVLTPPDGLTQVMLALPMWALYELGLLWARVLYRRPAETT